MLRAPIWITSAASTTSSTCRGSISSVTIGRPVSSLASRRMSSASRPRPWKVYGEVRGLKAPPRSMVAPAAATTRAVSMRLLAVLDRARAGDQPEVAVADPPAGDVDHGRVRVQLAGDELVRLQDRQHLLDARDSPRSAGRRAARARRSRRSPSPRDPSTRAPGRRPPRGARRRARSARAWRPTPSRSAAPAIRCRQPRRWQV